MWSGHFWMGGMWIFPLIILVVILIFSFSVFKRGAGQTPPRDSASALDILRKRYAGGEITKEEFDRMKSDITD